MAGCVGAVAGVCAAGGDDGRGLEITEGVFTAASKATRAASEIIGSTGARAIGGAPEVDSAASGGMGGGVPGPSLPAGAVPKSGIS